MLELTDNVWVSQDKIKSHQSSHEADLDCEMTSVDMYTEVNVCT